MSRCPTPGESRGLYLALCRSLVHEALALAFRPPTGGARSLDPATPPAAVLADAGAGIDASCGTGLAALAGVLVARPEWGDAAARAGLHERLFGHTARGPIPPYETEYGADTLFQKPQDLSDVAAFVHAFGLALDPNRHERIDHLSCELEFLAFLLRKEAHALQSGDGAMLGATIQAERLFLRDHLGRMAPAFARRVLAADPDGPYGAAAALLLEFVRSEADRLGVPIGPETLPLRAPVDDGAPLACGAADCAPESCAPPSGN